MKPQGRIWNNMIKEKISETIIELSPTRIDRFKSCTAFFVYTSIFPSMRFEKKDISAFGRKFHTLAEINFDKAYVDILVNEEKEKVKNQLLESIEIVKSRDYFSLPHENEIYLEHVIANRGRIRGYIDRLVNLPDGKIGIVDYKTSALPDVAKDKEQLMSYAYMLVKVRGVNPEDIVLILDYTKTNEVYKFELRNIDISIHHNYLLSIILEMEEVIKEWNKKKDIRTIDHTPGDCTFCPMEGICIAHRILMNPVFDGLDESEMMSNKSIAEELAEREYAIKINKSRVEALKRTLMARYRNGDTTVKNHVSVIAPEYITYRTSEVFKRIVPKMVTKSLKNKRFAEIVNKEEISEEIISSIIKILPASMDRSAIPSETLLELGDVGKSIVSNPYIKSRKSK